ncbi:MAG: hypothetical protein IKA45_01860 [Bacteroidales bacterium]|nr:hypothetical protein [Bacteroidales bacterium]
MALKIKGYQSPNLSNYLSCNSQATFAPVRTISADMYRGLCPVIDRRSHTW